MGAQGSRVRGAQGGPGATHSTRASPAASGGPPPPATDRAADAPVADDIQSDEDLSDEEAEPAWIEGDTGVPATARALDGDAMPGRVPPYVRLAMRDMQRELERSKAAGKTQRTGAVRPDRSGYSGVVGPKKRALRRCAECDWPQSGLGHELDDGRRVGGKP